MKHFLRVALLLLFTIVNAYSQTQRADTAAWVTNGTVYATVRAGNTIYLGGEFTQVGPNTGGGAAIHAGNGRLVLASLHINGSVTASVPDGKGGWYLGGYFDRVQGVPRSHLAHISADGTLDETWNPKVNGLVFTVALAGNSLYIGGAFTLVEGQARNHLAALDVTTGQVTPWNPNADGSVDKLVVAGDVVYISGSSFSTIGGKLRTGLAAVDATTGRLSGWNPLILGGWVRDIAVAGNLVYAGGSFTSVGGQSRQRLAAIDATSGLPTAWSPGADLDVMSVAVAGNVVYAGGYFSLVGGQPRNFLAAIDAATGQTTPWNPAAAYRVECLAVANNVVYAGGDFRAIGGQPRSFLAAIDAATGQLTPWRPNADYTVRTLTVAGNVVFAGGDFSSIGGVPRKNLAAIDITTGRATSWNPGADNQVLALAAREGTVYAGGRFRAINGQSRKYLAAIDAATGQPTAWNPEAGNYVRCLTIAGNLLYAGGDFLKMGALNRDYAAAFDMTTGQVTPWQLGRVNDYINAIAVAGNVVYIGGGFDYVGGMARKRLAAIDAATGQPTAWNPGANHTVLSLVAANDLVYAAGYFTTINGQSRRYLAAIDAATGQPTAWAPNPDNYVYSLAMAGNTLYAGGSFKTFDGLPRNCLAALNTATRQVTPWNPDVTSYGPVMALHASESTLVAGGIFTRIANRIVSNFAVFGMPVPPPNYIRGTVYEDGNGDCVKDPTEKGMAGIAVVAQPGNYFASTDSSGHYTLRVDTGHYAIRTVMPAGKSGFTRQICPTDPVTHSVRFTGPGEQRSGKDFANQTTLRPYLSIGVSSSRRRRCFAATTTVSFVNAGTQAASGVKVYVQLPPYVVLKKASLPFTRDPEKNYVFDVGALPPDGSGLISIEDSVVCNDPDIRGLTQCTKAWITPANATAPAGEWDKSDVHLKAACVSNGRVRLAVYNTGAGNMADSSAFRVYLDAQLAFAGRYKLAQGDSLVLQVPANGRTVRLEADQRPGHPTKQSTNATLEACGTHSNGTVSKGFVAQLPQDDAEPEVAVECLSITDSFDPNDKAVSPQGVTADKYTPTGKALDYVIRFQNTGTDVAYQVVVSDTLSEHLDLSTLQVGAVSHPYKMTVTGKGRPVLTFTFDNIMLPDSTADEPRSHGRIQFAVKPKAGLPEKTRIENFADIFFDYNEPVRTNTTLNTIYDVPPVVVEAVRLDGSIIQGVPAPGAPTGVEPGLGSLVSVFPNPTTGKVAIVMPGSFGANVQIRVYDALGRAVSTRNATLPAAGEHKVELDLAAQPAGVFVLQLQTPRGVVTRRIVRTGSR